MKKKFFHLAVVLLLSFACEFILNLIQGTISRSVILLSKASIIKIDCNSRERLFITNFFSEQHGIVVVRSPGYSFFISNKKGG